MIAVYICGVFLVRPDPVWSLSIGPVPLRPLPKGPLCIGPSLNCPFPFALLLVRSFTTSSSYCLGLPCLVLLYIGLSRFHTLPHGPISFFVLVLFWTSYFGPFSFCRLLFCPLILCPVCFLAFHYLVLRKFVLFHFVHRTMWIMHVHSMLKTHGCRRYVFFCLFVFCFVLFCFCIAAHIILLAWFNSSVINIHFVKLYDAIIFYYDSL